MECLTLLRHPDSSDSYGVQCRSLSFSLCRGFGSDKLDFGNATLACIPSFQLDRLQAVMNAAARLLFQTNRYDHITPLLRRLHWLRVPQRISFKLAVMMYQCVRGLGPAYLTDAIQPVAIDSRSTSPAVIVDVGIGRSIYTTVLLSANDRFPSPRQEHGTVCQLK